MTQLAETMRWQEGGQMTPPKKIELPEGRGKWASLSNMMEKHEMIEEGQKSILQVNYKCSRMRIWPSTRNFILSELTFSSKHQSNYLDKYQWLSDSPINPQRIYLKMGWAGILKREAESWFPERSKWLFHMDCGLELQFNGPWMGLVHEDHREIPGLPTSLHSERPLGFCYQFALKAIFIFKSKMYIHLANDQQHQALVFVL